MGVRPLTGSKVRIRLDGEEFVIPVPKGGMVIEVIHERPSNAPGAPVGLTVTKPYKLCLQDGGVQMR